MTPRRVVVLAALFAVVLSVAGGAPASVSAGRLGRIDHVADGDTVDLTNGAKVRLVQIDTPEVYFHPECYGKRASAITKRLLPPGTLVRLTREPATDSVDSYGRLLRYVTRVRGHLNVNVHLVAVGAAAPYFYRGRRGRYAARLTRLALRARRHHVGLGVAARARPTTRTGASPPGRRGDVLEPSNRPLVAGRRPGAIAHRRLAEAERGLRPAGGGLILVVPERDPGGAHRYTALPTASARVAGPQLVHVRPRLLGRRVGQQRRSLELVAELPLVIPRVLDGLRVRHEGQDAVGVLPDRPVGARRDEVASLGHCVVCIDNSSYYDCSGAPPGLLIRGLAPNAVELPDPRASPAWLDAGASRPVQSLRKLRKGFIAIGANTP